MYLFHGKEIWDPDLDNLTEISEFLDTKLKVLFDYCTSAEDPDAFGYYDQVEHFLGFGLIAFQTYMTDTAACAGKRKHETFKYGARTSSGASKVQIINAAANCWKHREEWVFDNGRRQMDIDRLFEEIGYSTRVDYPISNVLAEVLAPAELSFANLLNVMRDWRDDLIAHTKAELGAAPNVAPAASSGSSEARKGPRSLS